MKTRVLALLALLILLALAFYAYARKKPGQVLEGVNKSGYKWKKTMSGKAFAKELTKNGWVFVRQKGSHMIYEKHGRTVIVPNHKNIAKGTLKSLIKSVIFVEDSKTN